MSGINRAIDPLAESRQTNRESILEITEIGSGGHGAHRFSQSKVIIVQLTETLGHAKHRRIARATHGFDFILMPRMPALQLLDAHYQSPDKCCATGDRGDQDRQTPLQ
jgi:hypothetical protein